MHVPLARLARIVILPVGALLLAGCSNATTATICTSIFVYGITVDVRDATTGAALGGAQGAVHDGAYVDSLRAAGSPTSTASVFRAAGERPGTYTVEVVRPAYQPFTKTGVVVTRDDCHVRTEEVRADLVPR